MIAERASYDANDKKKGSRAAAATTISTNGLAVTTGYLLKLTTATSKTNHSAAPSWKRRYFMLRGCTLTYYADQSSMDTPKGELLVFGETEFAVDEFASQKYSFTLAVPFALLNLSCESGMDFFVWTKAFKASIALARQALTGYMDKVSDAEEISKRKFFILHQDALTFHKDEESMSSVQGLLHLNDYTHMDYYDRKRQIVVTDTHERHSLKLSFLEFKSHAKDANYQVWKNALISNLRMYSANVQDAETSFNTKIGLPSMIKKGPLFMRPVKGGDDNWPEFQFYLNESQMIAVSTTKVSGKEEVKVVGDFGITPNCSVFETNLGQNTFELVTASRVLHVRASTSYELSSWIEAIKEAIAKSYLDTRDELFQQSILKIDNDEFYTVHFTEKKPLGVVFERSGEWAIIKSSTNQAESGLLVGSVLSTIDKHSVILEGYQDTIDRLKGWTPPLVLGFRKAPRKIGFLLKESKSRSNPQKMVWKKRYFVLGEGRILYKDSDENGAKIKGECPLMGSVVSLVNEDEAGKRNCFRLMSGMMYLTLQSSNEYEMMDWASMLYHAISIANGGAYILQYEIDRLTAHAEDSKAAELALKGVRIPSVRIKASSKSPPSSIRRSLSDSPPPGSSNSTSTTYFTHTTTTSASSSSPTESYKKGSSWKNLVKQVMTVEQAENERLLELAMKNATCDDLGELVKMICHTKVHGINVDRAEKRLYDLKNQKKRRSEGPKTYRMDGEGEDDVQAQLSSIEERNERRRVADASAQLVRVVQSVGYDSGSINELERAIAQAINAGVSRENVEKAKQLLARLHEGNRLLEEALRQLQTAMRKRSLPMLVDAVSTASEIGFHHEQLQVDLASARRLIIEIKGEALDSSLQQAAIDATVDSHDNLATLVERAKIKDANVDPMKLHKAQEVLTDLRRKKAEKEDINLLIRRAINERNLHLLQTALQSATHSRLTGPDVDAAHNVVWEMQREMANKELQTAIDRATSEDYHTLEVLVAKETSGTAFSTSPRSSSTSSSSETHVRGDRVGAGHSVILLAYSRLAQLKATRKDHDTVLQNLTKAMNSKNHVDLDRAICAAEDIGFRHKSVEDARILLIRMQKDHHGEVRKEYEEKSKQEQQDAERSRALDAIKLEIAREEPQASTLKRALDNAATIGIVDGPVVSDGRKLLSKLNSSQAENALNRALDAAAFDRDAKALEKAIASAVRDGVSNERIVQARMTLAELHDDKANKSKALLALDRAVNSRDIDAIKRALDALGDMTGGGAAEGPEADRARKVMIDIHRERASLALQREMESPIVMTAAGFDEEKFQRLWVACDEADRYIPADNELLVKGKTRLEEHKVLKRKCNLAALNVTSAMETMDMAALELALKDSNLLSADLLLSACTLLGTLKQTNATAILNAAVNSSSRTSATLQTAIDTARRDGVKQNKITEAETVLTKLRRDETIIAEIDASLTPALESKNLESLEINLLRATAHSVTSKTIESARQLVGQLRLQGDDKRIMLLLADSLRLRSVSVLEHVIKSADDAGMNCELLTRAKEYLKELKSKEGKKPDPNSKEVRTTQGSTTSGDGMSDIERMALQYLEGTGAAAGEYSDDDDDHDDEADFVKAAAVVPTPVRKRSVLFANEHAAVEEEMKGLFSKFCSKIDSTGANCPEFINAMKFSSIWRLITGEKGNLFKEMQMYKRFDISSRGALSETDFLDGWAQMFKEPGGDVYLTNFNILAKDGFGFRK